MEGTTFSSSDPECEVLAKKDPQRSLKDHISDCLTVFERFKKHREADAKLLAKKAFISEERLFQGLFYCVAYHDHGKGTLPFQLKMRGMKAPECSHSLDSLPFIESQVKEDPLYEEVYELQLETLVVASHHSRLHPDKFVSYSSKMPPKYFKKYLIGLEDFICDSYSGIFGAEKPLLSYPKFDEPNYNVINHQFCNFKRILHEDSVVRDIFSFLKSGMHYCDWWGSGLDLDKKFSLEEIRNPLEQATLQRAKKRDGKQGRPERTTIKWHDFQNECGNAQGDAFLIAPTGSGKTEASLLWSQNNLLNHRLLYLLPTMTTTNKMRDRLASVFGNENVALVHGTSRYLLKEELEAEESQQFNYKIKEMSSFFYPATVSTVDQLLFSLFHSNQWETRNDALRSSLIILDEVHAYDPYTLGLIIEAMIMSDGWSKFCVISATLPDIVRKTIEEKTKRKFSYIEDKEYNNRVKLEINIEDDTIDSCNDQVISSFLLGKKVLVIVNTVNKSVDLFCRIIDKIKERSQCKHSAELIKNIMLFHSRFIFTDRALKENLLENLPDGSFIAITTQVVEVSLDIDFDELHTEAAPIDSLIQRFGRVNRNRPQGVICPAYVYQVETPRPYEDMDIIKSSVTLLDGEGRKPDELTLRRLVNKLYDENYLSNIEIGLKKAQSLVHKAIDQRRFLYTGKLFDDDISAYTRESDIPTATCIPIEYRSKVEKLDALTRIGYHLRVPKWMYDKNRDAVDGEIHYINLHYDTLTGITNEPPVEN